MNLLHELRVRRVPQITSGYVVGSWGLLQFLAFLESRMRVAPDLVNLIGLSLAFLLPTVITLAWVHGRPGKDAWGKAPKIVVPANLVAIALVLIFMFEGRELGAVTQTIAVTDENGATVERVVPTQAFRQSIMIYYPEAKAAESDSLDVSGEIVGYLLAMDLAQDTFVNAAMPLAMAQRVREAGSPHGRNLASQVQRKIARDAHMAHYLTSTLGGRDGAWELVTHLHESESGRQRSEHVFNGATLYEVADAASRQLRADLGVPQAHLESHRDLPVAEITSTDIEAVAGHVRAVLNVTHNNDWEAALPLLEDAVARDEAFAMAQFLLFGVRQTLGDAEGGSQAIKAAMEHLYRVPERLGFLVKAQYYYNEKQDADKAVAVLRMWRQLHPDDVGVYEQLATFAIIRQDLPAAVEAYEAILTIDPAQVTRLMDLADLQRQLGNLDQAESYLQRYVDAYPARADGYEELSDFYRDTGRLDEARDALEQAQLLEPEELSLTLSIIDLDIRIGEFDASEAKLQALRTEVDSPRDVTRVTGRLLTLAALRGQADVVETNLDEFHAASLEIQNPLQAQITQAMMLPILTMAGRPQATLDRLATVRTAVPAPYDGLAGVSQGWAAAALGRVDEARAHAAEAEALVEQFKFETMRASLATVDGLIAEAEGDYELAAERFREALELAVQVGPFQRPQLVRALRLSGDTKAAGKVLDEGLEYDPAQPLLHLEAAHLAHADGDDREARDHLDRALAAWPNAVPEFSPAAEARELLGRLRNP